MPPKAPQSSETLYYPKPRVGVPLSRMGCWTVQERHLYGIPHRESIFSFDSSKKVIFLTKTCFQVPPQGHCTLPSKHMGQMLRFRIANWGQRRRQRGVKSEEIQTTGDVGHWRTLPFLKSSSWKTSKALFYAAYKAKLVCRLISAYGQSVIPG